MKIVHICLASFFPDNYSYQENLLPKFHKKLGYDVEVIASLQTFDDKGNAVFYQGPLQYINEFNILVTRLPYKKPIGLYSKLRRYEGLMGALEQAKPDIIFVHGCQFLDIGALKRYAKKNLQLKIYVDNHADRNNSARNWASYYILHSLLWRRCAHIIEPFTTKYYGVLPARVKFLIDMYKLPTNKCDLLVMGADDDEVEKTLHQNMRIKKREEYGLGENDIVLVTGGKIDENKPQTLILMDAINRMENPHVTLLIFGSVTPELKKVFEARLTERVIHIGWRKAEEIYAEYAVADLVVFPGLHSVLWEQAVGMGKPCIFRRMDGFTHVDVGGNCMFFEKDTVEAYIQTIQKAIKCLAEMETTAKYKGVEQFSYKNIARRSLEID